MKSNYRWRRQAVPALIVAVAALGLSACGSGSGASAAAKTSAKTTTTASAPGPARGALAAGRGKLAACLKAHGVTLPAGQRNARPPGGSGYGPGGGGAFGGGRGGGFFGGGATGNSKAARAFRACAASGNIGRLPGSGTGRFTPQFSTATLASFAKCVKKNGFTLPAPNTSGKGAIFPSSIEKNAKFQAAAKSCESILRSGLPNRPGPGSPGGPSTSTASAT